MAHDIECGHEEASSHFCPICDTAAPAVDVEKALYKALIAADECIRLVPCATVQDAVTAMRKVRAAIALYESKERP